MAALLRQPMYRSCMIRDSNQDCLTLQEGMGVAACVKPEVSTIPESTSSICRLDKGVHLPDNTLQCLSATRGSDV